MTFSECHYDIILILMEEIHLSCIDILYFDIFCSFVKVLSNFLVYAIFLYTSVHQLTFARNYQCPKVIDI